MSIRTLAVCWVLFIAMPKIAQSQNLQATYSLTFEKASLTEVLESLEKISGASFYYRKQDLPVTEVSFSAEQSSLAQVLEGILSNTQLGFISYRGYAYIIAPKNLLETPFSAAFLSSLTALSDNSDDKQPKDDEITIGNPDGMPLEGKATVSGLLLDELSGEPVFGATVYLPSQKTGKITDLDGRFALELPLGKHIVQVSYIGYDNLEVELLVYGNGQLNLKLDRGVYSLEEVTVEADATDINLELVQIGVTRIDIKALEKMPVLMGELDVVQMLLLQPGVSSVGEGAAGFNVRGGYVDQNLIMQNDGMLFNASHALGFVSTFHADMIQSVALYKGIMPAQYGGRLASVLDVKLRPGNFDHFKMKAGLGPVTSRLNLETPVVKGKSSLNLGLRSTYSNWILGLARNPDVQNSAAFFYDANLVYSHRFNERNLLDVSFYASFDDFRFSEQFGFDYQTQMGQITYKHVFNDRLLSELSLTGSQYLSHQQELLPNNASEVRNALGYVKLKQTFTYTPNDGLKLDAGFSTIGYRIAPLSLRPLSEVSVVAPKELEAEQALESAIFAQAEWAASPLFSISAGLRAVAYQYLGPKTVNQYLENRPVSPENRTSAQSFGSGEIVQAYYSLEPRASLRYRLGPASSLKLGYARTAQFINQISNFAAPTPTSQWQLSTPNIQPMRSHNYSFGFFKNFQENLWETSVETYYRNIDQLFDYKDFAELIVNPDLETQLLPGIGRAYGVEMSIRKKAGEVLSGWLSYTLSRTEVQVAGINRGNWFPSNFDKTHDVSLVSTLQLNQRHAITFNFNYSTGRPTTAPQETYFLSNGVAVPVFTDRNQLRIPDYHRLDVSYTVGRGYNRAKKFKTSWTFSVYNLYSRRNAYSVFFTQPPFQRVVTNQFSVLGSAFPSITFNIETL